MCHIKSWLNLQAYIPFVNTEGNYSLLFLVDTRKSALEVVWVIYLYKYLYQNHFLDSIHIWGSVWPISGNWSWLIEHAFKMTTLLGYDKCIPLAS